MSLLNRTSDGLLSVLLALHRGIVACGPQSEAALLELVAPSSVVPEGKPDMARRTLTRWRQFGFFSRDADGVISLAPAIAALGADDLTLLRATILRLVLSPENNPGYSLVREDEQEGADASDCTRAMAWMLAQDPYRFPTGYNAVEKLGLSQGVDPPPFVNNTRWPGFLEWAVFLGAGFTAPKVGLVPNPSFAVRSVLDDAFGDLHELAQTDFFTRLSMLLPVVDGGRYRVAVEAQTQRPWRTQLANEISLSLSTALLTLEAGGILRLEMRSDAPVRVLLGRDGHELRSVSHLVRIGDA
jgi:hypothetical protein